MFIVIRPNLIKIVTRFSLPLLSLLTAFVSGCFFINYIDGDENAGMNFFKLFLLGNFGFLTLLALRLHFERFKYKKHFYYLLSMLTFLGWGFYFFTYFPSDFVYLNNRIPLQKIALLAASLISIDFLAAYLSTKRDDLHFWGFSQRVIYHLALTAFISGVLLVSALLLFQALDVFFNLYGEKEIGYSMLTIMYIIAPLLFLSSVPEKFDQKPDFPALLKNFSNYVLVPITLIYFLVLYLYLFTYLFSVVVRNEWPDTSVVSMALVLLLPLIIYQILIYPIKGRGFSNPKVADFVENKLLLLAIPVLLAYFSAIGIRIGEYGFTIPRGLVLVLGIWVTGFILYFSFFKNPSLKAVILGGIVLLLVASVGPLSVFSISLWSQTSRLVNILERNNALTNGVVTLDNKLNPSDSKEVRSIVRYLHRWHSLDYLEFLFNTDLNQATSSQVLSLLPLSNERSELLQNDTTSSVHHFDLPPTGLDVAISQYDYFSAIVLCSDTCTYGKQTHLIEIPDNQITLGVSGSSLAISWGNEEVGLDFNSHNFNFSSVRHVQEPIIVDNDAFSVIVIPEKIIGQTKDGKLISINSFEGYVFVMIKNDGI